MVLRLFKGYQAYLLMLIPLVGLAMWANSFWINEFELDENYVVMPLSKLVFKVTGYQTFFSKILALALVLLNALILSRMNIVYNFIRARTYLPAVIYILLLSFLDELQMLTPALMASVFVILAINKLLYTFKKEKLAIQVMDASLLVSLASLFYFPAIFLLTYIWIGLVILRPFRWREWAFTLFGMIVPYLFMAGIYFIAGIPMQLPLKDLLTVPFIMHWELWENPVSVVFWGFNILLIILGSFQMLRLFGTKKVHSRRFFIFFLWLFIVTVIVYFALPSASIEIFSINAVSLSFLFAHYLINIRVKWQAEILFLILVLLIVVNNIFF
jgi:hypothetical protein